MKKFRYLIFILSIATMVLAGCEKELSFDEGGENHNVIALSIVVSPDTTLEAIVARTYRTGVIDVDQEEEAFKVAASLKNATVTYSVNGAAPVAMAYDSERMRFRSDYRPKQGDVITIAASEQYFPSVSASMAMPQAPSFKILQTRKYQLEYGLDWLETDNFYDGGQDTVVDITLRLKDVSAATKNYYRLKVRSLTEKVVDGKVVYDANDCFSSSDPLFKDIRLTKPRKGWWKEFSNVFDDNLFNGKEYECVITSRLRKGDVGKRIIVVEFQSITEDLYHYLKSVMLYQVTDRNTFTEEVQIHTNVDGGMGIAGALAGTKQTLAF